MSFFVIFGVSSGTLFFGFVFLLLILEGVTDLASESIISFIDGHLVLIGIILGLAVILLTFFATRVYLEEPDIKHHPVWFAVGTFIVLIQAAVMLVIYVRAPFTSIYNGWLLTLFSIAIVIIVYIIYICITGFILANALEENRIYLLFIWPIVSLLFMRFIG